MLGYIVLVVCTVAVFLFILEPLIRGRNRGEPSVMPARLADLRARRDYLLDGIRDVDFDYSMGKLSDSEYQETRNRYIREAAQVLRDLEQESTSVDREIDAEIARLRELARRPIQAPRAPASPDGTA